MKSWQSKLSLVVAGLALAVLPLTSFSQGGAAPATLRVKVPAGATVTIDTYPTRQGGSERVYITPPLATGRTFTYEVVASWREGVEEKKLVLPATVRAGEQTVLDFTAPGASAEVLQNPPARIEPKTATPKQRHFLFTYAGTVTDLKPDQEAMVWLPVAVNTPEQDVAIISKELPAPDSIGKDKEYGNTMLSFKAKADKEGKVPFKIVYRVNRREVKTDFQANVTLPVAENKDLLTRFLQPDALVPTSGKPLELIKDKKIPSNDQYSAAKIFYDVVNTHMKYSKEGTGWGKGDSVWACDSKFGNCTDFHSLFISMARGNKIPSKFEMGFPLPPKTGKGVVGGYHCWAWFLPDGKGWIPVDISEANRNPDLREYYFGNLTEDRVVVTKGRDLVLEPPQQGPAVNFLIYPYVEVNGQPYPGDKVQRSFAYEDVASK